MQVGECEAEGGDKGYKADSQDFLLQLGGKVWTPALGVSGQVG